MVPKSPTQRGHSETKVCYITPLHVCWLAPKYQPSIELTGMKPNESLPPFSDVTVFTKVGQAVIAEQSTEKVRSFNLLRCSKMTAIKVS